MNTPVTRQARKLPAPADLERTANLGPVADELRAMISPVLDYASVALDGAPDLDLLSAARRAVANPLPATLGECSPAFLAAIAESPETATTTRLVTTTLDTRTGFRPADPVAYIASIVSSIARRGFGPKIVHRACEIIRETDPAEFHHAMPSEFHFLEACAKAKGEFETMPGAIKLALQYQRHATAVVARGPEIEAAEEERKRAAIVCQARERIAKFPRPAERADGCNASAAGQELLDAYRATGVDP